MSITHVQSRCNSRLLKGRTRTATFTDDMTAKLPMPSQMTFAAY